MVDDYILHFKSELSLGNDKLLDNKLRHAFKDLMNRFDKLRPTEEDELTRLQGEMLDYLKYLNHIKQLPLQFRDHTLRTLQGHVFLTGDMISCMLLSYRLAVELIIHETGGNSKYLTNIIVLAMDALNLSVFKLKRVLTVHHAPDTEDIRCVFHLTRIAMRASPVLQSAERSVYAKKILLTLTWHELIRRVDFFSKERESQLVLVQELERYIEYMQPVLYLKSKPLPACAGQNLFLQVFPDQPDHLSEVVTSLDAIAPRDMILFPLLDFLHAVTDKKKKAKSALKEQKATDFRQRERLQEVISGADMILKSLLVYLRHGVRREIQNTLVALEFDATTAMNKSRQNCHRDHRVDSLTEEEIPNTWDVLNYSVRGARLCSREDTLLPNDLKLGALVGLRWVGDVSGQVVGFIRWYKFQDNRYYMGIEFLGLACQLRQAVTLQKNWLVLQEISKQGDVWFPDYWVEEGMSFIMSLDEQKSTHCYVDKILQRGVNYSRCKVVTAASGIDVDVDDADSFDIEEIYI
ncbi:MAG: hypothetical protein Q9M28_06890 [Mariprofundaceae bacterium]|nr:hypothetical protein [Mariprofundaceae bacterium]